MENNREYAHNFKKIEILSIQKYIEIYLKRTKASKSYFDR